MLDLKFIRENIDVVKKAIRDKGESVDISRFEELDRRRRELIKERDTVRAKRKKLSFEIGKEKQRGKVITRVVTDTVSMSDKLKRELKGLEKDLKE
ncbi:MAG TPA: serine--tRNA ligase, partial [bacterium (Candidatus Stahlbacteria)]|nr:serine--tRNA ligase [Candidatus Stahlbacteria bacterium]